MNFFSIRTNDQNTIGKLLKKESQIVFDTLSWHKNEISIGDIVFIVISGDSSKKMYDYENGLKAIGKVISLPKDEKDKKHFTLDVEVFEFLPKTLTKDDFYVFPSLKDAPNIGPDTKSAPNQAFRKIDSVIGKSIIRALFDILKDKLDKTAFDIIVDNDYEIVKLQLQLKSKTEEDIKKGFYNYLKSSGKIETTVKQYISKLTEVGKWFLENNIVDEKYNVWFDNNQISEIDRKLNNELKELWTSTNKPIKNWFSSPWNAWNSFNSNKKIDLIVKEDFEFNHKDFLQFAKESGLIFSTQLIQRFIASLCTKPFVICSGLSGSGKTKLAQAFAQWISYKEEDGKKNEQYCIVPVGADWTNREPLLGYPNALQESNYIKPENGVLDLINRARLNETKPYFLILDEMNLSHVERYFADFLSTMESGDAIPLHTIEDEENGIPKQINLPKNLFIIGTVNIDETTYMFSPKVLDRANTIEFRLTENDLKEFIASDVKLDMDLLKGEGAGMGESFVAMATQKTDKNLKEVEEDLLKFFKELKKSGTEFGYRSASEMGRLMFMLKELGEKGDNLLDIAIMQKLLPKLHGSRNKLTKVLPVLGSFCLKKDIDKIKEDYLEKFVKNTFSEEELRKDKNIKYPISFEKICRMYKNAVENGFASYAEA